MRLSVFSVLLALVCLLSSITSTGIAASKPQLELRNMLKIDWQRGPNLPQGFQDSGGDFVGDYLVTVGGFCSGLDESRKPGHYPRGFLNKTWALNTSDSQASWLQLPDFPGIARQELFGLTVNNELYLWGGFNYTEPYCYADGYKLSRKSDKWSWSKLPDLPWPLGSSAVCAIGDKIYISGGSDYDSNAFYTECDRKGQNQRMGSRLLVFDTRKPEKGWTRLADCPGTPRWVACMAAVKGRIYLIGGATGDHAGMPQYAQSPGYKTVVDNWIYEPKTDKWQRMSDLPVSSGNFPSGTIVYKNRYILLIGGCQYPKVANPDGTVRDSYGTPSKLNGTGTYFNDVFVYDTVKCIFGTADPLPINNNLPLAVISGDELFLMGGECDGTIIDGEYYGRHPDLLLKGRISVVK
jgi:hypothetical protein